VLGALCRDVVVIVAERFPVLAIPEQGLVSSMWDLVVDDEANAARVGLR
jgi:hypothetical protein